MRVKNAEKCVCTPGSVAESGGTLRRPLGVISGTHSRDSVLSFVSQKCGEPVWGENIKRRETCTSRMLSRASLGAQRHPNNPSGQKQEDSWIDYTTSCGRTHVGLTWHKHSHGTPPNTRATLDWILKQKGMFVEKQPNPDHTCSFFARILLPLNETWQMYHSHKGVNMRENWVKAWRHSLHSLCNSSINLNLFPSKSITRE